MLCGGAYTGAKYYIYRLITRGSSVGVRFSDLRLSLFPLGLEIRNIRDFPIRDDNLVSFSGVNVYLPPTSLFMRKKAISIEVDRPLFILDDSLLKGRPGGKGLGSSFSIQRIRIRNGELRFRGRDFEAQLLAFNLQSGSLAEGYSFRVDSPHLKITLPVSGEPVSLEGDMTAEVHQQGDDWKISRFAWHTHQLRFGLNGRLLPRGAYQFNVSAQGNPESILRPLLDELTVNGLTYADARISRDAQRAVHIRADFNSPSCRMKENRCRDLRGTARWDGLDRTLEMEASFNSELARTKLSLASRGKETRIAFHDLPAAAIADILDITEDAPLAGIVRHGDVEFVPGFIRGRAELGATPSRPLRHPFVVAGNIEFQRDREAKLTTFSGQNLQLGAGELHVQGKIDSRAHILDIRIDAALKDMAAMAPYTAYYLDIDLLPWKLSGGSGALELAIGKRQGRKRIDSRFRLNGFQANRQAISTLGGEVHHTLSGTLGDITVTAPDLNSRIDLAIAAGRTSIHFHELQGEARKMMRILNLGLALDGRLTGDFTYSTGRALKEPEVLGNFTANRLKFMGYALGQVKSGLRSSLQDIELSGLEFTHRGGRARGDVGIDFQRRRFDLQGRIEDLDVSQLLGGFCGRADLEVSGSGEFMKDPLELAYRFRDVHYYPDRGFVVEGKASLLTDFSDFRLNAGGQAIHPAGTSPFTVKIGLDHGRYSGSFNLDLNDLDMLIPWKNNVGSMRLLGQIFTATDGGLSSRGVAVFSGQTLSLPNFSHSLDDFQGTVTFSGGVFSLQSLRGKMGGGPVEGNGQLSLAKGKLKQMTFNLQGKDLRLYPMDRAACLVNPSLNLKYEGKRLLLSGSLAFQSVDWLREIDERIVFSTRSQLSTAESKILEMLQLDIAMASENILMQNSMGRIRGRFKLHLTGTASFPVLNGTCEGSQGEIYFSDRSFNLLKAKLVFNNNAVIDPLIRVESEAFVQSYRIRFDIRGSASRAKPELSSSPPLPTQDILALVSLGEVFQRTGSLEISSREGGTALVTAKLTEDIKNRANQLLGIDLLRIDPVFSVSKQSTVDTSRLTIGKTLSKGLIVVYSTNLSTSRQEILYLQYQLSPSMSLIAMRNQEGRYSIDLRLRSRR